MDDESSIAASSIMDPFGLRGNRSAKENLLNRSSRRPSNYVATTPIHHKPVAAHTEHSKNEDEDPSFLNNNDVEKEVSYNKSPLSLKNRHQISGPVRAKQQQQHRLTVETVAGLTADGDDSFLQQRSHLFPSRRTTIFDASIGSPTTLLSSFHKNNRAASTPSSKPPRTSPQQQQLRFPQQPQHPHDRWDTTLLSNASPSDTISQLSISPVSKQQHRSAAARLARGDGKSASDSLWRPAYSNVPATGTADSRPHTSGSSANSLQQKRLEQVTAELHRAQDEIARSEAEKEQSILHHQQTSIKLQQLQRDYDALLQTKQLHESSGEKAAQLLTTKERDLAAWQATLHQQEAALERKREQIQRQESDWNELQETVTELEHDHMEKEAKLAAWHDKLMDAENSIEKQREELQAAQESASKQLEQRESDIHTQERRLVGKEKRLDEQTLAVQKFVEELDARERKIQKEAARLQQDWADLQAALADLEDKTKRSEAKFDLVEKAVQDLIQQRRDEEDRLAAAEQQRRDYLNQFESIKSESEQAFKSLQNQIRHSETEYHQVQCKTQEVRLELASLKQRIQTFVEADQQSRQVAAQTTAKADQNLTAVLRQLEVAQREKEVVTTAILAKQQELDTMTLHMAREEARWEAEQAALEKREADYETLRQATERNTKEVVEAAEIRIANMSKAANDKLEAAARDLKSRMQQASRLQDALNIAVRKYEQNVALLHKNEKEYQQVCDDLNQRMGDCAASESRENRIRVELERKVERLSNLIQKERVEHVNQRKSIETKVNAMRQDHQRELTTLTKKIELVESERDEKSTDNITLRQGLADREDEIELLKVEISHLHEQLTHVTDRCNEIERGAMQQKQDSENHDLEKMKRFTDRLEAQASLLEQHLKECELDRKWLQKVKQEYQVRLVRLQEKERSLSTAVKNLEEQQKQLESKCNHRARQQQKAAVGALLSKPWRQEPELVSAAFSKWVRTTMFEIADECDGPAREQLLNMERQVCMLQEQRDDADRIRAQVERESREALERELSKKRELQSQLRAQREKEQALYEDIQRLSREKDQLRRESRPLQGYDASSTDLKEREQEMGQREAALLQMERVVKEKQEHIADANERIRSMASQLLQKETALEMKEAQLAWEQSQYENAQSRLQKQSREDDTMLFSREP